MTIDIQAIPADRLALLDTATLFGGGHDGTGGPDCKHCARELLHEVVTGKHKDATPPGISVMAAILPRLNDGPWRDDAHRTEVMRPYLRKILLLNPAKDAARIYAILDLIYRKKLPDICDALKLDKHGSALRDLAPIVDRETATAVRALARALALALDLDLDLDLALARALDLDLDLDRARARALARALDLEAKARGWESRVREILDLVCGV